MFKNTTIWADSTKAMLARLQRGEKERCFHPASGRRPANCRRTVVVTDASLAVPMP